LIIFIGGRMMNNRVNQAVSLFESGLSCSQAILSTYSPLFGINQDDALRIARGFGGGMARLSETCGAVTGAFMVISIKYPNIDQQAKEETYSLIGVSPTLCGFRTLSNF